MMYVLSGLMIVCLLILLIGPALTLYHIHLKRTLTLEQRIDMVKDFAKDCELSGDAYITYAYVARDTYGWLDVAEYFEGQWVEKTKEIIGE